MWPGARSPDELKAFVDPRTRVKFAGRVQHETGGLDATCASVREIVAELGLVLIEVMVGCETGVLLTDELSHALGYRGNGVAKSELRAPPARRVLARPALSTCAAAGGSTPVATPLVGCDAPRRCCGRAL